jgi:hypothetical protein
MTMKMKWKRRHGINQMFQKVLFYEDKTQFGRLLLKLNIIIKAKPKWKLLILQSSLVSPIRPTYPFLMKI